MFDKARAFVRGKTGTFHLVVTSLVVVGYSDNRTVCGGACKMALADLAKRIENKFEAKYQSLRGSIPNLKVRRSKMFTVSSHVGAEEKFAGLTQGASIDEGVPELVHHQVNEYKHTK